MYQLTMFIQAVLAEIHLHRQCSTCYLALVLAKLNFSDIYCILPVLLGIRWEASTKWEQLSQECVALSLCRISNAL